MLCLFCGEYVTDYDAHLKVCDGKQGAIDAPAPVLNAGYSARLREEAIAEVDAGADSDFKELALLSVERVARRQCELVSDDIWKDLDRGATHDNRALGPVMRRAAHAGLIIATDRFQLTAQVLRHRSPVRIWRSLVYQGAA